MDLTALLSAILVIALIGFCLYLIVTFIPMPAQVKQAITVLVVVLIVVVVIRWLLGGGPILRLR